MNRKMCNWSSLRKQRMKQKKYLKTFLMAENSPKLLKDIKQ